MRTRARPGRFRLNVYFQRDASGAAFWLTPEEIKPLEALGIPPQVAGLTRLAAPAVRHLWNLAHARPACR
jgi:Tfp pilus assembly pilus retraction ATPase PilT